MNANKIVNTMLSFQMQIKVLHWQTTSYPNHMAFGSMYDYLNEAIDKFVEVYQGKYTRVTYAQGRANVIEFSDITGFPVNGCILEFGNFLISLTTVLRPKEDSDLLNIRDEILAETNKLKYLLTLK